MYDTMSDEEPKSKRSRLSFKSIFSDHFLSSELQDIFRKHWSNHMSVKTENLEIISEPFRVCRISNFLKSEVFLDELKTELSDVHSKRVIMDLYQHERTNDLNNFGGENISAFHRAMRTELVAWMENNTNIELNSGISMSSSCYYDTDYLLCHDDNMTDRRIAFVFYLVPNWSVEEGGSLDLFDTDNDGMPKNIVHSLYPEYNSLVFFEVSENSYHQVAEVIAPDMPRWTINGWLHGPYKRLAPVKPVIQHQYFDFIDRDEDLSYWINDTYLRTGIVKGINNDVEKNSSACLGEFVKGEFYAKLSQEVTNESIKWRRVGPANLRNYEIAEETSLNGIWKSFYESIKTLSFCKLVETYTELELVPSDKNPKPRMTIELQRWSKGCYTLICDKNPLSDYSMADECHLDDEKSNINSCSRSAESEKLKKLKIDLDESCDKPGGHEEKLTEPPNDWTTPNDTFDDDIVILNSPKMKKQKFPKKSYERDEASCSKSEDYSSRSPPLNPDSEDSQVSDIGDYLSDSSRCSEENSDGIVGGPGNLDVVIQFHTSELSDDDMIHYVDPKDTDGTQAHIPPEDNHLTLVYYKDACTCRVHKYINHYVDGYFYNLICTYHEKGVR